MIKTKLFDLMMEDFYFQTRESQDPRLPTYAKYLETAYMAAQQSDDPRTAVGCVIQTLNDGLVMRANDIQYMGAALRDEFGEDKSRYVIHAEQGAIYAAAALGFALDGATFFCPWGSCYQCARAMVSAGMGTLVFHLPLVAETPDRWKDEIRWGFEFMRQEGIAIIPIAGALPNAPSIRFDGGIWNPAALKLTRIG